MRALGKQHSKPWFVLACVGLIATALAAAFPAPAEAQQGLAQQTVPQNIYFSSFGPFYSGDYGNALEGFKEAASLGIRSTEGQWIDGICYHTMIGECYYHQGNLVQAQIQYDTALQLAVAHDGWMLRVEFPQTVNASASAVRQRINWGVSGRNTGLAALPERMITLQGRLDNQNVVKQGGVIAPPQYYPVRVQEIVRCTALSLRRRKELLGPVARFDPFTDKLVGTLSQRSAPANHWSQAWCSINLGLAYAASGKTPEAMQELLAGITIGGLDHPLTPIALLELGKLQVATHQIDKAAVSFAEAGFSAAAFGDADVLEESFRWGLIVHLLRDSKNVFPPLALAVQWARSNDNYPLEISLATLAAENFAVLRQTGKGVAALATVQRLVGRRDLAFTDVSCRYQYIAALLAFQGGDMATGQTALNSALNFQKSGSRWIFQIALADKLYTGSGRATRDLQDLFAAVLRDPTPDDWAINPQEALAVSTTHKAAPIEHWFEMQLQVRNVDKALEIADFARRQRFYSTLPLGGRLIALRWILEGPEELLGDAEKLQRKSLQAKYPHYLKLSQDARALRDKIAAQPLVPEGDDAKKARETDLQHLAQISLAQEAALREISLHRDASNYVFPPVRAVKDIQAQLGPKQAAMVFFQTSLATHVFAVAKDKYANWRIETPEKISRQLATFLRDVGQFDRNQAAPATVFKDAKWKASGTDLLKLIMHQAKPESLLAFDELVIVPDGYFWYVPFEALSLTDGGESIPLIKKVKIRYAPTLSLAIPNARGFMPGRLTAVVAGRVFPKDEEDIATEGVAALREALPGTAVLPAALPGPSALVAKFCDRAVVLTDLDESPKSVYEWTPFALDRGKATGTLAAWQALPFGGPTQVILPGFHTPAEYGMKRGGNGEEVFLNAMAFFATGARTVVLSRWRVGGQSTQDLMKSFVQELPHTSASAAWQRSVQIAMTQELDPASEPRVTHHATDGPLKGEHPFFWGGYMVIDSGAVPAKAEPPAPPKPDAPPPMLDRK